MGDSVNRGSSAISVERPECRSRRDGRPPNKGLRCRGERPSRSQNDRSWEDEVQPPKTHAVPGARDPHAPGVTFDPDGWTVAPNDHSENPGPDRSFTVQEEGPNPDTLGGPGGQRRRRGFWF